MPYRRTIAACFCCATLLSVPASGISLSPAPSPALQTAAARMRQRDYRGAKEAAEKALPGGARDLVAGMAAFKSGNWEEAVQLLSRSADTFPLLADVALAHEAQALSRLGRFNEAIPRLEKLLKEYPDSYLYRSASLLLADSLYDKGDFPAAIKAYQRFIEKYPSGNDALTALYKSALCRDQAGESLSAFRSLRQIWLNSPASPLAAKADNDLKAIAARNGNDSTYTAEELFRRGVTLYDLKKYSQAATALKGVPSEGQTEEFRARLALKTGQALLKSRQYREAEQVLAGLKPVAGIKGMAEERAFWLAKAEEKNGGEDAAVATYLTLVDRAPTSDLADDALVEGAFIRKWQGKTGDAISLLQRLLKEYPLSSLKTTATWELAWLSYRSGDLATAASTFKSLTSTESSREKALYWYGKTLTAQGDITGAKGAFSDLLSGYPFGFYAISYRKEAQVPDEPAPSIPTNPLELLPVPVGFERVKAMISFGLTDEATKELAGYRKKSSSPKALAELARLYLEMDDYNSALNLYNQERPRRLDQDSAPFWGIAYPLAFRDSVKSNAGDNKVAENLIYGIIRAESSFSPTALSPVGAVGLMQLMPTTAAAILGGEPKGLSDRLTRPTVNIGAGVRHLRDLLSLYNGNVVATIAAYNAGAGNVNKWLKKFGTLPPNEFIENIPFGETREYVKKVLAAAQIYNRLYKLGTPLDFTRTANLPGPVPSTTPATATETVVLQK